MDKETQTAVAETPEAPETTAPAAPEAEGSPSPQPEAPAIFEGLSDAQKTDIGALPPHILRQFGVDGPLPDVPAGEEGDDLWVERDINFVEGDKEPETPTEEPEEEPADEDAPAEETEETAEGEEEAPAEEEGEVAFSDDDSWTDFVEKADKYLGQVEITPEAKTIIDRLRSEADSKRDLDREFTDFGGVDEVKKHLDQTNNLFRVRVDPALQAARPNTDEFVKNVAEQSPEIIDWLFWDLAQMPSRKYDGLSKSQEMFVDTGVPLDKLDAFQQFIEHEEQFQASVRLPESVPQHLREAYLALNDDQKKPYEYEPSSDQEERQRIQILETIQDGINARKEKQNSLQQERQAASMAFQQEASGAAETAVKNMLEGLTKNLRDTVKFYPNARANALAIQKTVVMVENALREDFMGDLTRATFKEAGFKADFGAARQALDSFHEANRDYHFAKRFTPNQAFLIKDAERRLDISVRKLSDLAEQFVIEQAELENQALVERVTTKDAKEKKSAVRPKVQKSKGSDVGAPPKLPKANDDEAWGRILFQEALKTNPYRG